jgi:hypothetical protein
MNSNPTEALTLQMTIFHFLDRMIHEQGIYIYMVIVWQSPLLVVWILKGGFWRKTWHPHRIVIVTKSEPPSVPPKLSLPDVSRTDDPPTGNDEQSFAA